MPPRATSKPTRTPFSRQILPRATRGRGRRAIPVAYPLQRWGEVQRGVAGTVLGAHGLVYLARRHRMVRSQEELDLGVDLVSTGN